MEKTLTSIVYFASPAARSTFGSVKLSGQISAAQTAKLTKSCVAIRAASADNAKQAMIGFTSTNTVSYTHLRRAVIVSIEILRKS